MTFEPSTQVGTDPSAPSVGGAHRAPGLLHRRSIATIVLAVVGATIVAIALLGRRGPAKHQPPPPVVSSKSALQWAPPSLVHPRVIHISASTASVKLEDGTDYRLILPKAPVSLSGGLVVVGGHNVVLIGGTIVVPTVSQAPDPNLRRGMYLKGQTGTVHVEGIHLSGDLSEGIDLDESTNATVQIENVTVDTVSGTYSTNHADVIQTWAGPATLRVDGLRASSGYQGLFLLPNQHWDGPAPVSFDIRRSVIDMNRQSAYGVWLPTPAPWFHGAGLTLVDADANRQRILWPASELSNVQVVAPGSAGAKVDLPAGVPGIGYKSPGYKSATAP